MLSLRPYQADSGTARLGFKEILFGLGILGTFGDLPKSLKHYWRTFGFSL